MKNGKRTVGARKVLAKVRKDLKLKIKRPRANMRRNAANVLTQGVGAVTRRAFGTKQTKGTNTRMLMKCLDARIPRTLGLPRAVGPYTVIRTTVLHKSSSDFIMFAPFKDYGTEKWFSWCGIEAVVPEHDVTHLSNTLIVRMPMHALGSACEAVPAGLTVQVMNPASLQNADGIFAMTRVNQQMAIGDSPAGVTWRELAGRVTANYFPRLLSGGKLAIKGVKCDSYPLDMTEYSDFMQISDITGHQTTMNRFIRPAALAPIIFVQNNEMPKTIEFLVTMEWRVRFDPGNPATSSHSFHNTLPDEAWNRVISAMSSMGHGVVDLGDDIVDAGALVGAAAML